MGRKSGFAFDEAILKYPTRMQADERAVTSVQAGHLRGVHCHVFEGGVRVPLREEAGFGIGGLGTAAPVATKGE